MLQLTYIHVHNFSHTHAHIQFTMYFILRFYFLSNISNKQLKITANFYKANAKEKHVSKVEIQKKTSSHRSGERNQNQKNRNMKFCATDSKEK